MTRSAALRAWLAVWHAPGRAWAGMMRAGSLALWAQIGAGVSGTVVLVGFGLVIWLGPWPAAMARVQLGLLGWGMLAGGAIALTALVAIAGLKFAAKGGRDGFSVDVERDDEGRPTQTPPAGG